MGEDGREEDGREEGGRGRGKEEEEGLGRVRGRREEGGRVPETIRCALHLPRSESNPHNS